MPLWSPVVLKILEGWVSFVTARCHGFAGHAWYRWALSRTFGSTSVSCVFFFEGFFMLMQWVQKVSWKQSFFWWKGFLLETIQTKVLWTSKGKGWCNLKMCSYTSIMSFLCFFLGCCFNGRMGPRWMVRSIKFLFDFLSEAQKMKKMKPWRNS